jgi:hypothetical protein
MMLGSRVIVLKGQHKGIKGTIAPPPGGTRVDYPSHLVFVKLDGIDSGGFCGFDVFQYRKDKLKEHTVLDELAEI